MSVLVLAPCYGPPGTEAIARRLIHSASHFGFPEPYLYGLGRLSPGSPHGGDMQGTWVIEELQHNPSRADIVIACDCADVLFTGPLDEMLEKFKSFNSGFVIGADKDEHPRDAELCYGMRKLHIEAGGLYGSVNIGYWIADRAYALEILQKSIALYRYNIPDSLDSPQAWLPYGLVRGTIQFELDRDARIFQPCSAGDRRSVEVVDGRLHNHVTDTWPSMVHFNGSGGNLDAYDKMYRELIS